MAKKPDDPPKDKTGSSSAEELGEAVRSSTDFKRKHIDEEKLERKAYLREVLYRGTLRDFIAALRATGIGENTEQGQKFIREFRRIRGL